MRILLYGILSLSVIWALLTLWVQRTGPSKIWQIGNAKSGPAALIVFNPDPFYNLDEQVCLSFGQALADHHFQVQVATVAAAIKMKNEPDLYVLCANTYNWRPDRPISNFIQHHTLLKRKNVVAITLGSGSTKLAQQRFEKLIKEQEGEILDSRSLWLMKPNDESRTGESNVKVANDLAYKWGDEIAKVIISKLN